MNNNYSEKEEKMNKKKLLLLLLLLLLLIIAVASIFVFFKGDKDTIAATGLGNDINYAQELTKENLKNAIDDAEELTTELYTDATWQALLDVLAKGKDVYSKDLLTQEEIDIAEQKIRSAIQGLITLGTETTTQVTTDINSYNSNSDQNRNNGTTNSNSSTNNSNNNSNNINNNINSPIPDTTAPTAIVRYSNDNGATVTRDDVTVTIVASENIKDIPGWNKIDNRTFTKVYSASGKYSVEIEDLAGNKTTVNYEVKRIDKTNPVITGITNNEIFDGPVDYGITEESISQIIIDGIVYNENTAPNPIIGEGTHTIKVIDKAGNESDEITFIIDMTSATAIVTYSNNNGAAVTKEDVTVTIVANEDIKDIPGWNKIDNRTFTKVYDTNGKYSVEIEDLAGNKTTVNYEVKRIDRINPIITGIIDNEIYDSSVTYGIIEQSISQIIIDGTIYNEKNAPNPITGDGVHTIKVIDKAGNESDEITFIIDTNPPRIEINGSAPEDFYNESATIVAIDDNLESLEVYMTILGRDVKVGTTVKIDGSYKVIAIDKAGNKTEITFEIDTINPIISLNNFIALPMYNKDVTITAIEKNIDTIVVTKNSIAIDSFVIGDTVTEEGIYVVVVTDKAGNSSTVTFEIDKSIPIVKINDSEVSDGDTIICQEAFIEFNEGIGVFGKNLINLRSISSGTTKTEEGTFTLVVTDMAGNFITVTVIIDKTTPSAANITVKEKSTGDIKAEGEWIKDEAQVIIADQGDIGSGIDRIEFRKEEQKNFSVYTNPLKVTQSTTLYVRVYDKANNMTESSIVINIDKTAPSAANITVKEKSTGDIKSEGEWIKDEAQVIIADQGDVGSGIDRIEFRKEEQKNFSVYTSPLKVTQSTTLYVRVYDNVGHMTESSVVINIDKTAPSAASITVKEKSTGDVKSEAELINTEAQVILENQGDVGSGVDRIEFRKEEQKNFSVYTTPLKVTKSTTLYVRVYDKMGHMTESSIVINII